MMIINPASLPVQPVIDRVHDRLVSGRVTFGNSRLELLGGTLLIIQQAPAGENAAAKVQEQEKPLEQKAENPKSDKQDPPPAKDDSTEQALQQQDKRSFWQRLFKLPPLRDRIDKSLNEEWKFPNVRPRHIEYLMSEDGEEARQFFLNGMNARRYQRLLKEFGCGFQDRNGNIVDDSFDTINEYGPELIEKYPILIENRDLIKKYYAGVFRNGRIGTQSLIKISNSMWFGPFETSKFKMAANILNTRFQVPNHVIGPMLSSVGDSYWLRRILTRRTAPEEFQQLLTRISPSVNDGSGNAYAPALQLLVLGEEHKIPFNSLDSFVQQLKLEPKDFGPFSATVYHLGPYRLANEVRCPTFAKFLRRVLDEYGQDINQETARHFLLSFREFKDNPEALNALLSPQYQETRNFLRSIGTPVPSTVWNMQRIAILTQILTPEKKQKIASMVRQLSEEVKVADVVFLADISGNDEECKLLLNRSALLAAVKELKIDRIVERSHNDLVKELEREIDAANRNGFYRTVRRLTNLVSEEKKAYTESVDPSKLSNIQLSRLLIFHRSIEMPGFLETLGWNVSLDLQNDRSEGGGYLGYDKDMAMVTIVPGVPGDNRQYRPQNLFRAPASLALFHNHALNDTVMTRILGFLGMGSPAAKNKNKYAGPSGWVGAKKGDITAAAESDLPSFIITKIGYAQKSDGGRDKKNLLVNLDWVLVDRQTGEALRSDRGTFTVPYFGEDQLGKLKWPSKKEQKRQEKEKQDKCPPVLSVDAGVH